MTSLTNRLTQGKLTQFFQDAIGKLFENAKIFDIEFQIENYEDIFKPEATSQDFLKAITYSVEMQDLMKIKKTCYIHQGQDFCPIMVELIDKELKDHYNANYLLQVWDQTQSIVYERKLKYDVASWSVFASHLILKLDPKEEDKNYIYIVHLRKKGAITKVKEFVNDPKYIHVGIIKDLFFYASETTIKIIDIRKERKEGDKVLTEIKDGDEVEIDVTNDESAIATYTLSEGCKLHGFYENQYCTAGEERSHYIISLVEGQDNQIDFTRIYFWSRDIKKKDINFYQYTEVVPRMIRDDPIKKFKYICHATQFQFGVALRSTGQVDIYWNCKIVNSTKEKYVDVDINFDKIYLKKEDGKILQIETKWDIRVGTDVAEEVELSSKEWTNIFIDTVQDKVKLFSSYSLINTSFFLSHQNIVSLFDIVNKKWLQHFFVSTKVTKVFRNEKNDHDFNLGAYLENGKIELIDTPDSTSTTQWEKKPNSYVTSGKVITTAEDSKDYRQTYFLTKLDDGTVNLYGFARTTLYILNTLVEAVKETTNIITFFEPSPRTRFILYNKEEGIIRIYEHYWANNKDKVLTFYFHNVGKYEVSNKDAIKGKLHSAMTYDQKKVIYFFDYEHIYKFDVASGSITKTYQNENVQSIQFIDNKMCYMMVKKSAKRKQGFYVFKLVEDQDLAIESSFLLEECMNSVLDFSKDNMRLAYSLDYEQIQIIPVIHRNVINFMGMGDRSNYLVTRRNKDKFHALDKHSRITTWSLISGKIQSVKFVETQLDGYEVFEYESMDITYKREWYQSRCLLKKKEPETDWNDKKFYDEEMLQTTVPGDTPYISIEQKKFHKFKIIELINEKEVKVHYEFVHAFYGVGKYQRITFSDDMEYMLERLVNQRVLLYQRQPNAEKWKMIKRIYRFPMDMSENCYANYIFAPDFKHYIDYDRGTLEFVIKDTMTQDVYLRMSKGFVDTKKEEIKAVAKRFMWVSSTTMKFLNNEGIEKLYSIKDQKFLELGYGSVPSFQKLNFNTLKQYYFHQPSLALGDQVERLRRKIQRYKSLQFLSQNPTNLSIFEVLFDVDYSVDECKYEYVAEQAFSYLDWRLIEQMTQNDDINLSTMDVKLLEQISLCILPKMTTVLHEIYNKSNYIKALYEVSSKEGQEFEIPYLQNYEGDTPMHICLKKNILKNVDLFLQVLMNAPIDHHARLIMDVIPKAIDHQLPSIQKYLEKRFIQTEQIKHMTRGALRENSDTDYSSCVASLWEDQNYLESKLFQTDQIDVDIKVQCIDLPFLHCFNHKDADMFVESLAQTEDIDLLNNTMVKFLIQYKWPLVQKYTIYRLMFPFMLYHIIFIIYANVIFEASIDDYNNGTFPESNQRTGNYVCFVLLLIISAYFIIQEVRQIFVQGLDYLLSVWNYIDLIPVFLILIIIFIDIAEKTGEYKGLRSLIAITSLVLWFKILYFLRIFQRTGYLIRIIVQVIYDMRIFLLVFFISVIAFTDAFWTLSRGGDEYEQFSGENFGYAFLWTYRLSIGDIDMDGVDDSIQKGTVWVLFMFASVLNIIVLLNLLIAIISESFAAILENSEQANNQERARIINENSFLIPNSLREKHLDIDQYLFIAREINELDNKKEVESSALQVSKKIGKAENSIQGVLQSSIENLNKKLAKIDQLDSKVEANSGKMDGMDNILKQVEKKLEDNTNSVLRLDQGYRSARKSQAKDENADMDSEDFNDKDEDEREGVNRINNSIKKMIIKKVKEN